MAVTIYDLYNSILAADQPTVTTCITAIETQISTNVASNLAFTFDYDLGPTIGTLPSDQQIRIKDQIIYYFRNNGIRAYIIYTGNSSISSFPYAVNFNSAYVTNSNIIRIEWFVRNNREFAKAYV